MRVVDMACQLQNFAFTGGFLCLQGDGECVESLLAVGQDLFFSARNDVIELLELRDVTLVGIDGFLFKEDLPLLVAVVVEFD